jgi:hypothetical protein
MSDRFELLPSTAISPDLSAARGWRESAAAVRRVAGEVTRPAIELAAFHRADVWQGAVANRFGVDLDRWQNLLGRDPASRDELSLAGELVAVAERLEARASATEIAAGGDAAFWGRRDPP